MLRRIAPTLLGLLLNKNSESSKGMEIKTGQYIKLGRVCFKVKETSESAKDMSNVNFIQTSSDSEKSLQNTDALLSDNDMNNPNGDESANQGILSNSLYSLWY